MLGSKTFWVSFQIDYCQVKTNVATDTFVTFVLEKPEQEKRALNQEYINASLAIVFINKH